jgi:hypothetical protein
MAESPGARLHLIASDAADVPLLSALVQDAVLRLADISYDRRARRLGLMLSRFCRECPTPRRVKSVLAAGGVTAIKRRNWPGDEGGSNAGALNLLALRVEEDGAILLDFAGGASLRIEAECIDLLLDDVGPPWPAKLVPRHPDA